MKDKNKSSTNTVISGALSLTVSMLAVKILGVIYKIPLAQFLGEEGMGYFNSAYTVYSFFYLLCTAGVPKAIMILISEQKVKGRFSEDKIVSCAMRTFLLLGGAITLLLIIFAAPLTSLIGNSHSYATMLAVAPSVLFAALGGVLRGYYNANMSFGEISVSQVIEGAIKLAVGLAFAMIGTHLGLPLPIVSALTVLGVTFGALSAFLYLLICLKNVNIGKKVRQKLEIKEKTHIIKSIFSISLPITLSSAVMSISGVVDLALIMRRLVSSGYSESHAVSLYGNYTTLAMPMFNLAISLITPISVTFLPIFARAHASGDREEEETSIFSSLELSALISMPLFAGMLTYSRQILSLLFGNVGVELGATLLATLTVAIPLMSSLLIVNSVLEARGGTGITIFSMLFGTLFKLVASYLLLGGSYGIIGAPIGTVISYLVALISSLLIAKFRYSISFPIIKAFARPSVCAILSVSASMLAYNAIKTLAGNNGALLCAICICGVLYLGLLRLFGVISIKKLKEMSKYTKFA